VNPTQDIPQATSPAIPEKPADLPGSGTNAPAEKQTTPKTAADGAPLDLANLALATGLLLTAFLIFWMGLYLAHHVALRALAASFGTFALVWVLFRLRVFQRPYGGWIVAGSVALFAAVLPFAERGFVTLDRAARTGLAGEPPKPETDSPNMLPVPTRQTPPEPPVQKNTLPPEEEIVQDLVAPALDPNAAKVMTVLQDAKVSIGGRQFRILAGSRFLFSKIENGTVTFRAGDQDVTIDSSLVKLGGKSKETPEEITRLAKMELMRRYPAIGVKDSPENELFVARIKELQVEMPDLMKDPHWPLTIGEQLAAQEGWKRGDLPADDNAPPQPQPPADEPKVPQPPVPSNSPTPPVSPTVPQEAPK
jgi:hypothetical protein